MSSRVRVLRYGVAQLEVQIRELKAEGRLRRASGRTHGHIAAEVRIREQELRELREQLAAALQGQLEFDL